MSRYKLIRDRNSPFHGRPPGGGLVLASPGAGLEHCMDECSLDYNYVTFTCYVLCNTYYILQYNKIIMFDIRNTTIPQWE